MKCTENTISIIHNQLRVLIMVLDNACILFAWYDDHSNCQKKRFDIGNKSCSEIELCIDVMMNVVILVTPASFQCLGGTLMDVRPLIAGCLATNAISIPGNSRWSSPKRQDNGGSGVVRFHCNIHQFSLKCSQYTWTKHGASLVRSQSEACFT